jgi:FtsH-binding integral membrane protein
VTIYPVEENELNSIALLNTQTTVWRSIGSALAALLGGCFWDVATSEAATSNKSVPFMVVVGVASLGAFILASRFKNAKNDRLNQIKSESSVTGVS